MLRYIGKCPETKKKVYIYIHYPEWAAPDASHSVVRQDNKTLYLSAKQQWCWGVYGWRSGSFTEAKAMFHNYFLSFQKSSWKEGF